MATDMENDRQQHFRERKEKRVRELAEELSNLREKCTALEADNKHLEKALKEAQFALETLRSGLPQSQLVDLTDHDPSAVAAVSVSAPSTCRTLVVKVDLDTLLCSQEREGHGKSFPPTPQSR